MEAGPPRDHRKIRMFDFYPAYEEHFAQVQLSLFMPGMGATLPVGDFARMLRRPRLLVVRPGRPACCRSACSAVRAGTVSAGIEITMRNVNLALLLKASLFPDRGPTERATIGMEVMFVVLFYAGAAFFLGLPLALNFLRMIRRDERRRLRPE